MEKEEKKGKEEVEERREEFGGPGKFWEVVGIDSGHRYFPRELH